MAARRELSPEPEYADHDAYLFCKTINDILKAGDQLHINSKFLTKLVSAIRELEPKMQREEQAKDYLVPENEDAQVKMDEAKVAADKEKLKDLELQFLADKQQIQLAKDKFAEEEDLVVKKSQIDSTAEMTELNRLYQERLKVEDQYDRAKDKLSCCSCFPCVSKPEKRDIKNLERQLRDIEGKIDFQHKKIPAKELLKSQLDTIEKQIQAEDKKLDTLIKSDMPTKQKELIGQLKADEFKLQTDEKEIEFEEREYNANICKENMLFYLKAYVLFLDLYDNVNNAVKARKDYIPSTDPQKQFLLILVHSLRVLDDCMNILWCNQSRIKASLLAKEFLALNPVKRLLLITGKANENFMDELIANATKRLEDQKAPSLAISVFSAPPAASIPTVLAPKHGI